MPPEIRRLSKRYLNDPAEVTIKTKDQDGKLIRPAGDHRADEPQA
jgi:ATP-dependent RNA helicase DeaD